MGFFNKWFQYGKTAADQKMDEKADPKVQLEQAIREAQDQHDQLSNNVAQVIANQKQAQMRLDRLIDQEQKLERSAKAALDQNNDAAAQSFATQLVSVREQVGHQKEFVVQATQSAANAHKALQENEEALSAALAQRQGMLGQIDQAEMQESMNKAMSALTTSTQQHDVPTLDDVQKKIDAKYALASGQAEVQGDSVAMQEVEVHHQELQSQASAVLAELKGQSTAERQPLGALEPKEGTAGEG